MLFWKSSRLGVVVVRVREGNTADTGVIARRCGCVALLCQSHYTPFTYCVARKDGTMSNTIQLAFLCHEFGLFMYFLTTLAVFVTMLTLIAGDEGARS